MSLSAPITNKPISPDELPTLQALLWQSLAAEYAPLNRLLHLGFTFIVVLGLITAYWQPWIELPAYLLNYLPLLSAGIAVAGVLLSVLAYLADKRKYYALRDLDLSFSSGLIFRKIVTQPITRIQHIEVTQGPLERYKGLASLQVFSAGGAQHTFEIPGLHIATAQKIRQLILQHKDVSADG